MAGQKMRADQVLAERGFFESRSRARQEILAGSVFADGKPILKPSQLLASDAVIVLGAIENPYVSRGGLKLAFALDHFGLSPAGCTAMDVGASTGGFSDVLLERGARAVYAIDVGQGQLHPRLRGDHRLTVFEKTDMRAVTTDCLPSKPNFAVCDVSFISLLLVAPSILDLLAENAIVVFLIKPQFEVGPQWVEKGGIVRDAGQISAACKKVSDWLHQQRGWGVLDLVESPITGGDGNREILIAAQRKSLDD